MAYLCLLCEVLESERILVLPFPGHLQGPLLGLNMIPCVLHITAQSMERTRLQLSLSPSYHLLEPLLCTYWFVLGASERQGCEGASVLASNPCCAEEHQNCWRNDRKREEQREVIAMWEWPG